MKTIRFEKIKIGFAHSQSTFHKDTHYYELQTIASRFFESYICKLTGNSSQTHCGKADYFENPNWEKMDWFLIQASKIFQQNEILVLVWRLENIITYERRFWGQEFTPTEPCDWILVNGQYEWGQRGVWRTYRFGIASKPRDGWGPCENGSYESHPDWSA